MSAYDIATKVDPASYSYSANTLNASARTTRYTADSWNTYISALTVSKEAMANVITSGGYAPAYNSKSISAIADNISKSISALKYNYIVEYVNYAGESMGCVVCDENESIKTDIVKNTDILPGTPDNQTHTEFIWPAETLTREEYGDAEIIRINETANSVACTTEEKEIIEEATCTSPEIKLLVCTQCFAEYRVEGEKRSHEYTATVVAPTCTQPGYTHYVCENCGDTYDDHFTAMIEHTYVSVKVEPGCETKGYTAKRCSVCGYEIIDSDSYTDALQHEYTYEIVNEPNCIFTGIGEYTCTRYTVEIPTEPNIHAELIFARTVSPTDVEMGYDIYYCSNLCGYWEKRNYTPAYGADNDFADYIEAYNAALSIIVTDFKPFTDESISIYNEAVQNAVASGNQAIDGKSVQDIEKATKDIIEATSLLRIKTCRITIYINTSDGEIREFNFPSETIDYGETFSIDISDELNNETVEKWTVEKNGITRKAAYCKTTYDMVATDDTVVNVYLTDEETAQSDSSKITMLNQDGRIIATVYVQNGYNMNLTAETLLGVTAPKVPFYQFCGWKIVSGNSNAESDTVVQAAYTVI